MNTERLVVLCLVLVCAQQVMCTDGVIKLSDLSEMEKNLLASMGGDINSEFFLRTLKTVRTSQVKQEEKELAKTEKKVRIDELKASIVTSEARKEELLKVWKRNTKTYGAGAVMLKYDNTEMGNVDREWEALNTRISQAKSALTEMGVPGYGERSGSGLRGR